MSTTSEPYHPEQREALQRLCERDGVDPDTLFASPPGHAERSAFWDLMVEARLLRFAAQRALAQAGTPTGVRQSDLAKAIYDFDAKVRSISGRLEK